MTIERWDKNLDALRNGADLLEMLENERKKVKNFERDLAHQMVCVIRRLAPHIGFEQQPNE